MKRRLPQLDGLRALAISAVFWFHYRIEPHSPGEWGWVGVDLFFAISGFLITGILFDSLDEQHYFRNFYIRRVLRIFPLYWGLWCILIAFMLASEFDPGFLVWPAYVGNYLEAYALSTRMWREHYNVLPAAVHFAHHNFYLRLGPYWSLCVKEQFYLTWPLVIWLIRRRERLLVVCAGALAFLLALRIVLYHCMPAVWVQNNEMYFWTFTRADSLLAGAALALWVRKPGRDAGFEALPATMIAAITAAAIAAIAVAEWRWGLFSGRTFAEWMQTWGLTAIGVAAGGVIALSLRLEWLASVLSLRPLQHLGRVSYGFYVFHLLFYDCDRVLIGVAKGRIPTWLIHAAVFAWVWLLSWASFRWYETPFLRLKERWGRRAERRNAPEALTLRFQPIVSTPTQASQSEHLSSIERE